MDEAPVTVLGLHRCPGGAQVGHSDSSEGEQDSPWGWEGVKYGPWGAAKLLVWWNLLVESTPGCLTGCQGSGGGGAGPATRAGGRCFWAVGAPRIHLLGPLLHVV